VALVLSGLPRGTQLLRSSSGLTQPLGPQGSSSVLLALATDGYDSLAGQPIVLEFGNRGQRRNRFTLSVLGNT
jgi:hypothetical protein